MQEGDLLVLYTDGIIEAQNKAGELFGYSRLCSTVSALSSQPPAAIIAEVLEHVGRVCRNYNTRGRCDHDRHEDRLTSAAAAIPTGKLRQKNVVDHLDDSRWRIRCRF